MLDALGGHRLEAPRGMLSTPLGATLADAA